MFIYPISLTIAAGAALLNIWLMVRVGQVRGSEKVSVGDGGNERVLRRMRAHSNFIESAPLVLILLLLVEIALGSSTLLWAIGALYLLGRVAHVFGMDGFTAGRVGGAIITILTLLGLAILALWTVFMTHESAAAIDILVTNEISIGAKGLFRA